MQPASRNTGHGSAGRRSQRTDRANTRSIRTTRTVTVRAQHFGLANYTLRFNKICRHAELQRRDPGAIDDRKRQSISPRSTRPTPALAISTPNCRTRPGSIAPASQPRRSPPPPSSKPARTPRASPAISRIRGPTHPITLDVTYDGSHARTRWACRCHPLAFRRAARFKRSRVRHQRTACRRAGHDGVSDQVELLIEAEFTRPIENVPVPGNTTREPVN